MKRLVVSIVAAVGALVGAGVAHAVEYPEGNFDLELGSPAAQPGATTTLSGVGGAPGGTLTVFLDTIPQPTGGNEVQIGTGTVNPDGSWLVTCVVPNLPYGTYAGRVVVPLLYADVTAAGVTEDLKDGGAQSMRIEYQQQSFVLAVTADGLLPVVGGGDPFPTLRLAAGLVVAGAAVVLTVVRRRRLAA